MSEQNQTALAPIQAVPEGTKAITKYTAEHGREVGLPSPEAINYMTSVAGLLTRSALITPDMGADAEQVKANAMAKMLVGHEMGIGAMEALQDIDIVKGRIFIRYPQLISQMLRKGFKLDWRERSNTRAALYVEPPTGYPMLAEEFEFTIEDAKAAGLTAPSSRTGQPSQYVIRPRVMLSARVVSEAYRMTGGRVVYTPEERDEVVGNGHREIAAPATEENPFKVTNAAMAGAGGAGAASPGNGAAAPKAEEAPATTQAEESAAVQPGQEKPKPATEKPAEEKARGRRKPDVIEMPKVEAAKPEPPKPEPPKPEAAKPAETAKPAFQATDADLPANLAPKPQADRLAAVVSQLAEATQRDTMAVKEKVRDFIRAWLNIPKLPVPPNPSYETLLPVLESMARQYGAKLLADPTTTGLESGTGWNKLVRHIDQWSADAKAAALALAIERFPDGPDMVMDLIETFGAEDLADVAAFLQVYRISKSAMKLKELGPAAKVVASWGLDLATATEAQVLSKLAAGGAVQPGQPSGELWQE